MTVLMNKNPIRGHILYKLRVIHESVDALQ